MQSHAGDAGVFIRSMATRGHLGGLARATADAALVLDAAGKDVVIIETVGVGQDEVDIVRTADVSIVTLVPGTGDEVQALKAGIMEIADIFVVNKADREGSDHLVSAVETNLSLHTYRPGRVAAADREDRGDERAGRAGARDGDCGIPCVCGTGPRFGGCEWAGGSPADARRAAAARARLAALHGSPRARGAGAGRTGDDRRSHRGARDRSRTPRPTILEGARLEDRRS